MLQSAGFPGGERRGRERKQLLDECVVVRLGAQTGLLLNASSAGIAVQASTPLTTARKLPVSILVRDGGEISASAEVVWTNEDAVVGLQFTGAAEQLPSRLEEWLISLGEQPETVLPPENLRDAVFDSPPTFLPEEWLGLLSAQEMAPLDTGPADSVVPAAAEIVHDDPSSTPDSLLIALQRELMISEPPLAAAVPPPEPAAIAVSDRITEQAFPLESVPWPSQKTEEQDLSLGDVLIRIVEQARTLTEADGAAVALRDNQGIKCRASSGNAPPVGAQLRPNSGLSGECFSTGRVVQCHDMTADSRVDPALAQRLKSRSLLIVPIPGPGATAGLIEVLSCRAAAFSDLHVAILQRLADVVASLVRLNPDPHAQESLSALAPELTTVRAMSDHSPVPPQPVDLSQSVPAEGVQQIVRISEADRRPDLLPVAVIARNQVPTIRIPRHAPVLALSLAAALGLGLGWSHYHAQARPAAPSAEVAAPALGSTAQAEASLPATAQRKTRPQTVNQTSKSAKPSSDRERPESRTSSQALIRPTTPVKPIAGSVAINRDPHSSSEQELPPTLPAEAVAGTTMARMIQPPTVAPTLNAPKRIRVSEGVIQGNVISRTNPIYPKFAVQTRVQGAVVLTAVIGTDGLVKDLKVVSGNPLLASAATEAVRRWRYQPYRLDGIPVEVDTTITLKFTIPR